MKKQMLIIVILLMVTMFSVGCNKNIDTVKHENPPKDETLQTTRDYLEESINLLELTEVEEEIYNKFAQSHNDEDLKNVEALTVCKLYIHAGKVGDYETEYALYIQDDMDLGWTKEEHMNIPEEHRKSDWSVFENDGAVGVEYTDDNKNAEIFWPSTDKTHIDANGNPWVYSFHLSKNNEGIWKVRFLPIQ